jgi:hypothetical protein
MSFPLQVRTQDKVLAAQVRGVLNQGPEWGTTGSTLATVGAASGGAASTLSTLTAASGAASATSTLVDVTVTPTQTTINNNFQTLATKLNLILNLLQNLNLPAEGS